MTIFLAGGVQNNSVAQLTSLTLTGVAGAGFIGLGAQSAAPTVPAAASLNLYSDNLGRFVIQQSTDIRALFTPLSLTANRVFTLPDLAGTFALTANNLGVFSATTSAQLAGIISDETGSGSLVFGTSPALVTPDIGVATGTSLALTGIISHGTEINTGNGAASVSQVLWNGTVFTGGTGTTTFPAMFVQPTGTTAATTWSTSGTGLGMNLASGFAGNFLDFHVNGAASVFSVSSIGLLTSAGLTSTGSISLQNNRLSMSGAQSAAAWTTSGRGLNQAAATWTDTTSSGTIAAEYINAFLAPTLAFSSATTVTNAYNTYFVDPVQGTNATLTAKWALGGDSAKLGGINLTTAGNLTNLTAAFSSNASGYSLNAGATSATAPTVSPNRADTTTGIGAQASGNMSMIVGGAEIGRWTSAGVLFQIANSGVTLKQGANGRVGTFVANGVTPVTVTNSSVAVTDAIIISLNTGGGTVGTSAPVVMTITAGVGFTTAALALDSSTYNYAIIKNA